MNALSESIQRELDNMKLKYEYNGESEFFAFYMNMDNSIGSLKVIIQVLEERYLVYAFLNNRVQRARISEVSEFLHRANFGLINGNFELDFETGGVRYKSFVNAKEAAVSGAIIRESVTVPVVMFGKYGDALLSVMTSRINPEAAIRSIN